LAGKTYAKKLNLKKIVTIIIVTITLINKTYSKQISLALVSNKVDIFNIQA